MGIEQLPQKQSEYRTLTTDEMIRVAITHDFNGNIAMVSSFGTESAILLHLMAKISVDIPVLFLDTEKLFPETLAYVDKLINHLGLTNVQRLHPDKAVYIEDADGTLWDTNYDRCCELRKVIPLQNALKPYKSWITGRKQYHGGSRSELQPIEHDGTHYKINPLYNWPFARLRHYMDSNNLPDHPLLDMGYLSVGCVTCTKPSTDSKDPRAGRWSNSTKDECGIHF